MLYALNIIFYILVGIVLIAEIFAFRNAKWINKTVEYYRRHMEVRKAMTIEMMEIWVYRLFALIIFIIGIFTYQGLIFLSLIILWAIPVDTVKKRKIISIVTILGLLFILLNRFILSHI